MSKKSTKSVKQMSKVELNSIVEKGGKKKVAALNELTKREKGV